MITVPIGRVGKPHGLKGAFFLTGAESSPELEATVVLSNSNGDRSAAHKVAQSYRSGGHPCIRLETINSLEEAVLVRGQDVWLETDAAETTPEGTYLVGQITGYQAVDHKTGAPLGKLVGVESVHPTRGADGVDRWWLERENEKWALCATSQAVIQVDHTKKSILLDAEYVIKV